MFSGLYFHVSVILFVSSCNATEWKGFGCYPFFLSVLFYLKLAFLCIRGCGGFTGDLRSHSCWISEILTSSFRHWTFSFCSTCILSPAGFLSRREFSLVSSIALTAHTVLNMILTVGVQTHLGLGCSAFHRETVNSVGVLFSLEYASRSSLITFGLREPSFPLTFI